MRTEAVRMKAEQPTLKRNSVLGGAGQGTVLIPVGEHALEGELIVPRHACGLVLFAHGSGSSRHSVRNQCVAQALRNEGCGTLLFDLLTRDEEAEDAVTGHLRFNIRLLAERLIAVTRWARRQPEIGKLPIGYFGSSTGAAAALGAAVALGETITAVVSRGGRPDMVREFLPAVSAATLLIVGGDDDVVLLLNQKAYDELDCQKRLDVVPGATHLFEEPGALEEVARLAANWFQTHFKSAVEKAAR
jgi:putative phosphoribosyl transferase